MFFTAKPQNLRSAMKNSTAVIKVESLKQSVDYLVPMVLKKQNYR